MHESVPVFLLYRKMLFITRGNPVEVDIMDAGGFYYYGRRQAGHIFLTGVLARMGGAGKVVCFLPGGVRTEKKSI